MGKIAFFNVPAQGHITPTIPVVKELVRRGESVHYFMMDEFCERIEPTGATPFPMANVTGYDYHRPSKTLFHLAATLANYAVAYLPALLERLSKEDYDVFVYDSLCPWGRIASQILQKPGICSNTSVAMHPAMIRSIAPPVDYMRLVVHGAPALWQFQSVRRTLKSRYGVDRLDLFDILTNHGDLTVVYTSREFQPLADRFDDTYRFVGPPHLPTGIPQRPAAEKCSRPTIYIALGTQFNDAVWFYRTCMQAFANIDADVLMSVGNRIDLADLGQIPANFTVQRQFPQLDVLTRTNIFISHGGLNSIQESLFNGVPLLVFPFIGEQAQNGRIVEFNGAGRLLFRRDLQPERLRQITLSVMQQEQYVESARRIGSSFREAGGYGKAADEIIAFRTRRCSTCN